jgi:serine/threonine protein kinase
MDKADMQLIDFINKCLVIDPEDRMSPQLALDHAWLIEV